MAKHAKTVVATTFAKNLARHTTKRRAVFENLHLSVTSTRRTLFFCAMAARQCDQKTQDRDHGAALWLRLGRAGIFVCFAAYSFFVPFVASAQSGRIAEILIHGNHTTPDTDILAIAALQIGEAATTAGLAAAEQRLRDSGRFEAVEVRRRFESVSNPDDILVVLLVDERPGVAPGDLRPGVLRRLGAASMWLPILNRHDGYAITYGARLTLIETLGPRTRLSAPLTWGGERRAAVEVERTFVPGSLLTALRGRASVHRSVNPHFALPDSRRELRLQADRAITPWLRTTAETRVTRVAFAARDGRTALPLAAADLHRAAAVHLVLDTRVDPSFPRNAVHTVVGWEWIGFRTPAAFALRAPASLAEACPATCGERRREGPRLPQSAGRLHADLHGYVGIGGAAVLALRGRATRANAPLPLSEWALLGGSESLRGYRAGYRGGDSMAALSAEVRVPLTSPLSTGRFGVRAFVDADTTWNAEARLADQRFDRGIGGGLYLAAAPVTASVDLAWPERGKPRVHVGVGLGF